jgi:lytic murein transglycosylase
MNQPARLLRLAARIVAFAAVFMILVAGPQPAFADAAFQRFLQSLWPQAQAMGITRATFDAAIRGLEPDLSLPDLELPSRRVHKPPGQAEFIKPPSAYISATSIARLAARGKKLAAEYRNVLARIEQQYGVPGNVVIAIWGRETAYGGYNLPHSAIRVLATQAYVGRRKDQFRQEFLLALKILQEGHVSAAALRSSWAGAMGHTQFLPTDFYKHAVDFDGDGRRDIWRSIPDSLASTASQLVGKGWERGERWAYEVRAPKNADCSIAQPGFTIPIGEWIKRGFTPAYGRKLSAAELTKPASLLMPEGSYGPAFLTPKNYFVLKEYNFSDLYVLFVGHLSDRIGDGRPFETPWSKNSQLRTTQVESMQRVLTQLGLYRDKIDGKAGMLTRSALGAYQKANGLKLDCWPTAAVLDHMQRRQGRN